MATLWRIAFPTSQASKLIPTAPTNARAPRARSRTGTMIRKPLPKIDARGVTEALNTEREASGFRRPTAST